MSMTRKDYELIAAAIKRHLNDSGTVGTAVDVLHDLAQDLAGEFAASNPAFKAPKFLKACGID